MSRSLKKKPYVEERLMKRIVEMNESGKKQVVKTWSRSSTIYPEWSIFPYIAQLIWLDTNWVNLLLQEHLEVMQEKRKLPPQVKKVNKGEVLKHGKKN